MYHKHPKRSCHLRKVRVRLKHSKYDKFSFQSLRRMEDKGYSSPKVEMPGSGPVAPPRSSRRSKAGLVSAEPSPAQSRAGTLARKPSSVTQTGGHSMGGGHPMAGRPLPPPPPVGPRSSPPPPALPKKSASVSQMTGRYPQRQSAIAQPSDQRRESINRYPSNGGHQYPVHSSQYPSITPGNQSSIHRHP